MVGVKTSFLWESVWIPLQKRRKCFPELTPGNLFRTIHVLKNTRWTVNTGQKTFRLSGVSCLEDIVYMQLHVHGKRTKMPDPQVLTKAVLGRSTCFRTISLHIYIYLFSKSRQWKCSSFRSEKRLPRFFTRWPTWTFSLSAFSHSCNSCDFQRYFRNSRSFMYRFQR